MAEAAITKHSVCQIFKHEFGRPFSGNPVMQVLHVKPLKEGRYRVILSDTDYFVQSMLAGGMGQVVVDGLLKRGSIVQLVDYHSQVLPNGPKRILVITNINILSQYGEPDKLGDPKSLDSIKFDTQPQPQPQSQPQPHAQPQPQTISGGNFYGGGAPAAKPAQHQQPTGQHTERHGTIQPIEALSPYSHKWTIRARVSSKGPIRSWHNANGEGRLFSVNFLDESGEIRATAFNSGNSGNTEQFDAWYEMLQEGFVYYISAPCAIKLAKKQFSQVNNDYELTFERDTKIERAQNQGSIPQVRYHFIDIEALQKIEKDTTIDTIGVLKEVGDVSEIVSKTTQKPFSKRELTIVDTTKYKVRLTIWGDNAMKFDAPLESVLAFKGVKVSDFNGRSLSLLSSGSMSIDPDIDEAHRLKGWYDAQGRGEDYTSHNQGPMTGIATGRPDSFKTCSAVKDERLGFSSEPDFFSVKATVMWVKKDSTFYYPSCQSENCKRKVVEHDPGQWKCESCDKAWPKPLYRYILQANVGDHSGQLWLSAFDDAGKLILGCSADELHEKRENLEEEAFASYIEEAMLKTYNFRCRAKLDTYNDEQRVRYQVMQAAPLNYSAECAKLAEQIKQFSVDDDGLFVS